MLIFLFLIIAILINLWLRENSQSQNYLIQEIIKNNQTEIYISSQEHPTLIPQVKLNYTQEQNIANAENQVQPTKRTVQIDKIRYWQWKRRNRNRKPKPRPGKPSKPKTQPNFRKPKPSRSPSQNPKPRPKPTKINFPSEKYGQTDQFKICQNYHRGQNKLPKSLKIHPQTLTPYDKTKFLNAKYHQLLAVKNGKLKTVSHFSEYAEKSSVQFYLSYFHYAPVGQDFQVISDISGKYFLCMRRSGKVKLVRSIHTVKVDQNSPSSAQNSAQNSKKLRLKIPDCLWNIHFHDTKSKSLIFNQNCCSTAKRRQLENMSRSSTASTAAGNNYSKILNYNLCNLSLGTRKNNKIVIKKGNHSHYTSENSFWYVESVGDYVYR